LETKSNLILHETQIFGPIGYFAVYYNHTALIIEKFDNYQKRSWRNRYQILTVNGPLTLSIPLAKGKNNRQTITDVAISYDQNWIAGHLHTLRSAYGKSPYFDYYFPDIEKILRKKYKFLFDLNETALRFMLPKTGTSLSFSSTTLYKRNYSDCLDLRDSSIDISADIIRYPQVWQDKFDFIPNLSILDLLFCMGPEAPVHLKKINLSSLPNKF
jgi:hypothetical protein